MKTPQAGAPKRPRRGRKLLAFDAALEPNSIVTHSATFIEPHNRQAMIQDAAYFRAERRGFDPGHELDDWLEAEREIDAALARGESPPIP